MSSMVRLKLREVERLSSVPSVPTNKGPRRLSDSLGGAQVAGGQLGVWPPSLLRASSMVWVREQKGGELRG